MKHGESYAKAEPSSLSYPRLSVIVPCRNEEKDIIHCLKSVDENEYPGEIEIFVVDAMSEDRTRSLLRQLQLSKAHLTVLDNPQGATPVGLNIGLQAAAGDLILILGAHCELGPRYISTICAQVLCSQQVGCSGGLTIPVGAGSPLQRAIAGVQQSRFGVGGSLYKIPGSTIREVDTVAYGIYRRSVLKQIGFFDERLLRNQDIELNARITKSGKKIILDPSVAVFYHARRSLFSFVKQNFGNGLWNVLTSKICLGTLSIRHFVPLASVLLLILFGASALFWPATLYILALMISLYAILDILAVAQLTVTKKDLGLVVATVIFPVLHLSYGLGSLCGLFLASPREGTGNREVSHNE